MSEEKIKELIDAGELEHHPRQGVKADRSRKPPIPVIRLDKAVDLQKVIKESKS